MSLKATKIYTRRIHMTVNNQTPTDNVELEYTENTYWVELFQALERLQDNKDFIKVISEGYFRDKAVDGVSLLATDYVRQSGTRGSIMEELVAISALENYFQLITNKGAPMPEDDE